MLSKHGSYSKSVVHAHRARLMLGRCKSCSRSALRVNREPKDRARKKLSGYLLLY